MRRGTQLLHERAGGAKTTRLKVCPRIRVRGSQLLASTNSWMSRNASPQSSCPGRGRAYSACALVRGVARTQDGHG